MAEVTGISWAHATLNFWIGCTKVGTACDHCYAEAWGHRFGVAWGAHAERRRTVHTRAKAAKLERLAEASGGPFYCFSNSLSDIFDNAVPIAWLAEAFADMRAAPHVTFLLLTKRPQNTVKRALAAGGLPPNAALGCTIVTQAEADRDLPWLLAAISELPAAFGFVSMEPLREAVDIAWALSHPLDLAAGFLRRGRFSPGLETLRSLAWVIAGGESGPRARPTHPAWLRSLRDQCAAARTPFHFKQWGEWAPLAAFAPAAAAEFDFGADDLDGPWRAGRKAAGRLLDGVLHDALPEQLNVAENRKSAAL